MPSTPQASGEAVAALDEVTRHLRVTCPWDREQDARSIVPHTVEEAYELADAARSGDDSKLADELGDVLFQVHFLALLLEERGTGSMAEVAEHARRKLIRRHPHVYSPEEIAALPEQAPSDAGEVLRNWDAIKATEPGRERGIFGEVPENLPAPLYARKVQRRAATSGLDSDEVPYEAVAAMAELLPKAVADGEEAAFAAVGDLLFAAVNIARKLAVDPELSLRGASDRFRGAVEGAEALAERSGRPWDGLTADEKLSLYAQARFNEA